jgi:hypothetical protein
MDSAILLSGTKTFKSKNTAIFYSFPALFGLVSLFDGAVRG